MEKNELLKTIETKYQALGENPETYLKGLLHAKPINYWDYVEVDTLLSLQRPRTDFKDESIFIMYHQVTELVLKMMLHEIEQLVYEELDPSKWVDKFNRLNRYTSMLITSFEVMRSGMNYDDYNTFRSTLTPASGFQSVQFRYIEIYCTRLVNLVNEKGKQHLPEKPTAEEFFQYMYWKDAGMNRKTGSKTLTLQQFEAKYLDQLLALHKKVAGNTLEEQATRFEQAPDALHKAMKEFDHLYNVEWPLVHLKTAQHYLDVKGKTTAATGGSEWKKYLHPHFQQRKFFPELWSETELQTWGGSANTNTNGTESIQ